MNDKQVIPLMIELGPEDLAAVQQALDNPQEPTEELRKLMTKHSSDMVERVARAIYEASPTWDWDRPNAPPGNWQPVLWGDLSDTAKSVLRLQARAAIAAQVTK